MVTNVTSLTGNGLKDWLIQRATAVYLVLYTFFLGIFFMKHPQVTYAEWHQLFARIEFKVATILVFIALSLHAWIGLWTVSTDYVKKTKIRLPLQMIIIFFLITQFLWGVIIVWGQ